MLTVNSAMLISKLAHKGQKYGDHDYFDYHVMGVYNIVCGWLSQHSDMEFPFFNFDDAKIAALLHDVVEDTDVTAVQLDRLYSWKNKDYNVVPDAVDLLTDPEGKNRKERKEKWLDKVLSSKASIEAGDFQEIGIYQTFLIVKWADRLFNIRQGGKLDMYRKEQEKFRQLFESDNKHINKLFPLFKILEEELA